MRQARVCCPLDMLWLGHCQWLCRLLLGNLVPGWGPAQACWLPCSQEELSAVIAERGTGELQWKQPCGEILGAMRTITVA